MGVFPHFGTEAFYGRSEFPYVKWRDGRPRSSHGAYARALGFVDSDLRHPPHDERTVRSARGSIFRRPPIFLTSDGQKSKRRGALASFQKRLRCGSAQRSRTFWTTGANRPSSKRCRRPRNHPIANRSLPSCTGHRRARPLRKCAPRYVPPSCSD